jgi:Tfp pilus assembly protein PilZ
VSDRDRRTNPRFVCDLDARVVVADRSEPLAGRAVDLSFSGVCVDLTEPIAVGTKAVFHLQLVVPEGLTEELPVPGTVVWSTPTRGLMQIGARFHTDMDDAIWRQLEVLLRILSGELQLPTPSPS